jgi:hypothetical protein
MIYSSTEVTLFGITERLHAIILIRQELMKEKRAQMGAISIQYELRL